MSARITVKGQVTIPKAIRQKLGIGAGSRVEFEVTPDGKIMLTRSREHASIAGILHDQVKDRPPVSIDEMNQTIADNWGARHGGG